MTEFRFREGCMMAHEIKEYIGYADSIGDGLSNMGLTDTKIIRCLDCKHYRDYKNPFCMHFSTAYENSKTKDVTLVCSYVNPNGFCAWAERDLRGDD